MKPIPSLFFAGCLLSGLAIAQSPVKLGIHANAPGEPIPADFSGLSFETGSLQYNSAGVDGYLFDSTNAQLLTLFQNLGIKNLRIGGSSVDANKGGYIPTRKDIDAMFRFAKAADVSVIYSLRLLNGNPSQDASTAKYVWDNYRRYLLCFAIGNEPNLYKDRDPEIKDEASYLVKWRKFAAIVSNSVPGAKFGGPDNGTGGTSWAAYFAKHEVNSGKLLYIFSHNYGGGGLRGKSAQQLIDEMLSSDWDTARYPAYYSKIGRMASSYGLPYRLTELNSFVAPYPGVWGGNNSFATALFALDAMYWWAAHDSRGVNFHTVVGKYNGTIYRDKNGNYQVYPIGYGIKAFDVGGHGKLDAVTITNPNNVNLTAYAVTDATDNLLVTIVNKEHGANARGVAVTLVARGLARRKAAAMFLTAPNSDVGATSGITLGGASITNDASWHGKWSPLKPALKGQYMVIVPATSAAIIKIARDKT